MSDQHRDPEQLESDIAAARARVGQTVDRLGAKLSPGELLDQVMGMTTEHGGEFAKNLGQQIKANPLALLVTGVGMTWLAAGDRGTASRVSFSDTESYTDTDVDDRGDDSHSGVKRKLEAAGDSLKSAKDSGSAKLQAGKEQAVDQAQALQSQIHTALQEQPLVVGGLGIALGAALGALLPASETENRLMGSASDQAMERAGEAASEQYDAVRDKAKSVAEDVKQTAKRR